MFENPSTKRVSQNSQAKVKPKITGCTKVDINITRRPFIDKMSKNCEEMTLAEGLTHLPYLGGDKENKKPRENASSPNPANLQ